MTLGELLSEFHSGMPTSVPEPQRRIDLYNALRHAGEPLIDVLRKDLTDPDPRTVRRAMSVMARLGNNARPLISEIITIATGKDDSLRAAAISSLCRLRDPRCFDLIVRAAHDPAPGVRMAVVRDGGPALADARFAVAVNALDDPETYVRSVAIGELKLLNDKRAVAYLAPLLDDETIQHYEVHEGVKTAYRVCDRVADAFEYLVKGKYLTTYTPTQEQLDARVAEWRKWWKEHGASFDAALYVEPDLVRARE